MNKYLHYLEKVAKEGGLQEHQSRSVDKLLANKGVILDHSTGSGKTKTILEATRRIQKLDPLGKQLIITPASLTSNISKESDKHKMGLDHSRIETISYDKAVNDIDRLRKNKYSLIAMDEAHKIRNTGTKRNKHLSDLIAGADHRLLATATPLYNSASDISPLVNAAAGHKMLPTNKDDFENRYIKRVMTRPSLTDQFLHGKRPQEQVELTNKKELSGILSHYVDHYDIRTDPKSAADFPTKIEQVHEVAMSPHQQRTYKFLEGKVPYLLRMKIRHNLPLDKKESASLNAFSTGIRQASNSTAPYDSSGKHEISPKIQKAVENLHSMHKTDKNFRAVVYSNYLKAGLDDYSSQLKARGINHTVYHGGLSKSEKDSAVKNYNEGKNPVLLISSSGAEGLDLKGTKLIQTLEPHFNNSKINQVIGRGIRYKSHSHLPVEERKVLVQHYASKFHPGMFGGEDKSKSIDQYLRSNAIDKDDTTDKIRHLLKEPHV